MTQTNVVMPNVRVLVADSMKARWFGVDSPQGELNELETFTNVEAKAEEKELRTDRNGVQRDSGGYGLSSYDEGTQPQEVEFERFSTNLVRQLEKERSTGKLKHLYLVATPSLLGEMRKHMSSDLKSLVVEEIDKNLASLSATEIRKHLPTWIR